MWGHSSLNPPPVNFNVLKTRDHTSFLGFELLHDPGAVLVRQGSAARRTIALIGTVEVRSGRAYFNGQPLEDAAAAELATKCRSELNSGR